MNDSVLAPRPAHVPASHVLDIDVYDPPGVAQDLHGAWKRALHAPGVPDIVWTPRYGGHWIAARGALIHELYGRHEDFSNKCIFVPKELGLQHRLLPTTLDPPEHLPFRLLINPVLAPRAVERVEGDIRALAAALIDGFLPQGRCNFTRDYAEVLPIRIFMMMCDLPVADAQRLKYLSDQFTRPDGSMTLVETTEAFFDYLGPVVDARMGGDGEDMLSVMLRGVVNGRALERTEALELLTQVLVAGMDTVVNFLSFAMLFLAQNPAHRRELAEQPALLPAAIEELLRRFPLVTVGRLVRNDVEIAGVQLKAGEVVIMPTPLAGIDERVAADPMRVDFHRGRAIHTTFGNGVHRCPGSHLARTELSITLEEWLKRIPEFSVAPDAEIRFKGGVVGAVEGLPLVW